MIIWGGYGDGTTTNAPAARQTHAAVWTGSEMIVWGGFISNYSNTGGRYNPVTDSWTATSTTNARPLPEAITRQSGPAPK
jgi:hypothetical protein